MSKFESKTRMRAIVTVVVAVVSALIIAGCGGDDNAQTGEGAPPGATGGEAGGFAVEAGKQRDSKDLNEEEKAFSEEPAPIQILSGNETGYRVNKPTVVLVQSKKELSELSKTHFSRGVDKQTIAPIDYKTRQLVALVMPESPKGSLVAVTDVHEEDGKIVVEAVRLLPGKGCATGKTKPRPISFVETRQMKGDVKLEITDTRASPCD